MAHEPETIDIENEPALLRLVEEARESGKPRLLRIGDADVAVLQPLPVVEETRGPEPRREITEADWEAFRSSAGSWKDIDVDTFLADIYASRDASVSTEAPGSR